MAPSSKPAVEVDLAELPAETPQVSTSSSSSVTARELHQKVYVPDDTWEEWRKQRYERELGGKEGGTAACVRGPAAVHGILGGRSEQVAR